MLCERVTDPQKLADRHYIAEPKLDGRRAQLIRETSLVGLAVSLLAAASAAPIAIIAATLDITGASPRPTWWS
jgi:hypothetical protein